MVLGMVLIIRGGMVGRLNYDLLEKGTEKKTLIINVDDDDVADEEKNREWRRSINNNDGEDDDAGRIQCIMLVRFKVIGTAKFGK